VPAFVVVGAQWGDEGKGKIVDLLTERVDIVARYGGGPNAGHTIVAGGHRLALHHIPSGNLNERVTCVIGNGVVVDPASLLQEIAKLREAGVKVEEKPAPQRPGARSSCRTTAASTSRARRGLRPDGWGRRASASAPPTRPRRRANGVRVADLGDPATLRDKVGRVADCLRRAAPAALPAECDPDPGEVTARYLEHGRALRAYVGRHVGAPEPGPRRRPGDAVRKARRGRCSISTTAPIRSSRRRRPPPAAPARGSASARSASRRSSAS
jgi:adenylosuccinate synthase